MCKLTKNCFHDVVLFLSLLYITVFISYMTKLFMVIVSICVQT